jgi:urease accessory protein
MKLISHKSLSRLGVGALALASGVAQAHTGHGTSGVVEGLVHPLGLDHLLAMLAVGIWSVSALPAKKAWWGPTVFTLSLILSAALGTMGIAPPLLEPMISLSVVLFGAMLIFGRQGGSVKFGLAVVALAASLHGLAHGAETPETGFATYALGFLLTTATLHFGGVITGLGIRRYGPRSSTWTFTGLGTLFGAAGLYLFSQL